jgi:EmrB/QacA subfamily drug resistance transporter
MHTDQAVIEPLDSTPLPPTEAPRAHNPWLVLAVVLAAECMDLLDGTVVNVAAPTIHSTLHTSSTGLQWIIGGYPLALAVGLLVGGRLGDLFGRRTMFLIGAVGFTLASTVCGLAPSTAVLIGARLCQGLAGAMMIPQGLGLMREVFPPEDLKKAFALFGPVMGSAAMIGPIIGGGLIALNIVHDAWRPVFLINLPVGLAATVAAARLLPRVQGRHARELDLFGAVLATLGSAALIYPLIQGRSLGWPSWCLQMMGASIVLFAVLAVHMLRRKRARRDPLIEPSVFGHRGYSAGSLVLMLFFGGMAGSMLGLTLFMQLGEHFSAIHAGLTVIPFSLGTAFTAPVAAGMMQRLGGRLLIQAGALVTLAGYVLLVVVLESVSSISTWGLIGPLLVIGLGMGLFIVPVFDTVVAAVTDAELGSASGALNAVQQLGGAIGVAGLGTVFFAALPHVGFLGGLRHLLWWQVGGMVVLLALTPLLPKFARPEGEAALAAD